ncbi:MAG: amidase [Rhodospirillales bacterium 20-64-7]|nr:MAG: amidase [Rhodospirillales bacterium 20-64-7]HQT76668.1 creatininase family protein [Rhodopila sp.]
MLLQHQTWQEVERYLGRSKGIILPIGSTEQHGPNGLIGTDAICAEIIAKGAGEAAEAMVGPTIGVGIAVHHMGFAGSMTVRPSTLIAIIHDYVLSLARHGFRRFFFVNGHGGNIATVQAAFSEIYAAFEGAIGIRRDDELRCRLANWWDGKAMHDLSKEIFGDDEGSHATASEVAVTQYALPDTIKTAVIAPPRAPTGRFHGPADYRRRFPDGRIGSNPSLATPEKGKRFYDTSIAEVAKTYTTFIGENE